MLWKFHDVVLVNHSAQCLEYNNKHVINEVQEKISFSIIKYRSYPDKKLNFLRKINDFEIFPTGIRPWWGTLSRYLDTIQKTSNHVRGWNEKRLDLVVRRVQQNWRVWRNYHWEGKDRRGRNAIRRDDLMSSIKKTSKHKD